MNGLTRTLAVGLLGLAAACSQDGTSPVDVTLDRDVALFAADAAGQDIEMMRGPGGLYGLGLPALPGRFECDDASRGGLTITRTCAFYDADGNEQDAFDPQTTDVVVLHAELAGTIDRGAWSATVSRERDYTASGLEGDETTRTWDGTGSGSMTRIRQTRDGGQVQMDMVSEEEVIGVVIPVPRTSDGWPLAGTITSLVTVTITGGPRDGVTRERDVTITFDGTQYATVTVNGETFTIDLASRQHARRGRMGPGGGGHFGGMNR